MTCLIRSWAGDWLMKSRTKMNLGWQEQVSPNTQGSYSQQAQGLPSESLPLAGLGHARDRAAT